MSTKVKRDGEMSTGCPKYLVIVDGVPVGEVFKRRGGWWGCYNYASKHGSQWCSTRKEAVEKVCDVYG